MALPETNQCTHILNRSIQLTQALVCYKLYFHCLRNVYVCVLSSHTSIRYFGTSENFEVHCFVIVAVFIPLVEDEDKPSFIFVVDEDLLLLCTVLLLLLLLLF